MTTVYGLHWNIAGSDVHNGFGKRNATRGDDVGRYAKKLGFDVFLACEAGQISLRRGINKALGIKGWMSRAKSIWYDPTKVKNFSARKTFVASGWSYLRTNKYGAAFFGEKDGIKFSFIEVHTDYRKPAKQAKQVQAIFKKWRAHCDKLGIKHVNMVLVGDFNWDGSTTDNPFRALRGSNFVEKGDTNDATFFTGKHLDGVLAHRESSVHVERKSRSDGKSNLSDHYPIKFHLNLH